MLLPDYITTFIPNMGFIPLVTILEENKKACLYRHASKKLDCHSLPVNELVSADTEPEIHFGRVPQEYVEYIWNIWAKYPTKRILQYTDDLASCFNQQQTTPNLVGTNASVWNEYWRHMGVRKQ